MLLASGTAVSHSCFLNIKLELWGKCTRQYLWEFKQLMHSRKKFEKLMHSFLIDFSLIYDQPYSDHITSQFKSALVKANLLTRPSKAWPHGTSLTFFPGLSFPFLRYPIQPPHHTASQKRLLMCFQYITASLISRLLLLLFSHVECFYLYSHFCTAHCVIRSLSSALSLQWGLPYSLSVKLKPSAQASSLYSLSSLHTEFSSITITRG